MAGQTRSDRAADRRSDSSPDEWAARVRRLESEVTGLRQAMRTRGLIEQAKGMLAERLGIDPEESFGHLSRLSQDNNVRVVDVAADIVGSPRPPTATDAGPGARASEPSATEHGPGAGGAWTEERRERSDWSDEGRLRLPGPGARASEASAEQQSLPAVLARRVRRVAAAVEAAPSILELAEAVAVEAVEEGTAACVFGLEPGGGLRILSAHGWAPRIVADWRHVPSPVATPATRAAQLRQPLWLDGTRTHDLLLVGPGPRRAAFPLSNDGPTVGVLELAWPRAEPFDDTTRRYLAAVAEIVARRLSRMTEPAIEPSVMDDRWLETILDGLVTPALLLAPVHDDDKTITDFTIVYANAVALDSSGLRYESIGRRLIDLEPGLVSTGVFAAYVRAYEEGAPLSEEPNEEIMGGRRALVCRQAIRLGNQLLATWQGMDNAGRAVRHLDRMEILGGLGWADWDLVSGEVYWSPGLFRLLGRDPGRGPVSPKRLGALVVPDDLPAAAAGLERVLRDGVEASGEIRLHRGDGEVRHVRVVAEPRIDHRGQPTAVLALAQDVTEVRRRDVQLSRTGQQLAAQRIRLAAEQAHTDELRRLLYPAPEQTVEAGRLRLLARHLAPKSIHQFRGDFYDVIPTDDGAVITLGDVFGSGAAAATAVARLRHAARVLCLPGMAPATILALLNEDLTHDAQPPMASLVVARFSQETLWWAQAGHFAPILLRNGRGRSLQRPPGVALGLTPNARYEEGRLALRGGDTLIFFTDGLISALDADSDPVQHLVRGFGQAWRQGGAAAVLDGFLRPSEDEACVVAVELLESSA
jgi:PAS domain-containing protein